MSFIQFIIENRDALYNEYQKNEEVKRLLHPNHFKTFFQPIVSLQGEGNTVGFEVLNRPVSTPLFPTTDIFYDYVSKSNFIFEIERFIRNLALERYLEQQRSSGNPLHGVLFLNIQAQVLADPNYQKGMTLELLAKHHLSPSQIVLELTEKEAVVNYNQFEKVVQHYREQGFRIAVDDAGTGYNSLQTLLYLKPDYVKIDKSLIRNIEDYTEKQHLVELLLDLAAKTGIQVIAEGIETTSELEFLTQLGVGLGQGYALGRPNQKLVEGSMPLRNII